MIAEIHFNFNEHPVIGFILMLFFLSGGLLIEFANLAHGLALLLQIVAYSMTILVGYRTWKKMDKDGTKPNDQQQ